MANKQVNITNNSPNYTKNNSINNVNYVQRNGAGWSWFKTIFIACMLTIFSVVCFAGGKNAIPQGYTNSIRQETISTLISTEIIPPNVDYHLQNLTPTNIYDYKFRFINYDNYVPYSNTDARIINNNSPLILIADIYGLNPSYSSKNIYYSYNFWNYSTLSTSHSLYIYYKYNSGNSVQILRYDKTTNIVSLDTKFDYFAFKLTNEAIITNFVLFKQWLINNFTIDDLETIIVEKYAEYPITYATYDWNIKLTQLSKLKNVFTPLFSANVPNEEITLQNGFDQFQEFIDLGILTYIGDKTTPNNKFSSNWEYNSSISSIINFDEMIHLINSNLGKYINANYWYDESTRTFVRFDTNIIYGSINDTNTTLQNVINLLSYPITTGFNITYNIGVLFTFIFVW